MTIDTLERETDTALISIPQGQDAHALFTARGTAEADRLLAMVRAKIDAFKADIPDIGTASGRAAIKSFAHKVAKSKTAIEDVGKELAAEAKDIPKRIDANRKHIRDTLDAWRDEVRQPVTDWEAAEEDRVNRIKADLAELQGTIDDPEWIGRSAECLRDRKAEIERQNITESTFEEYLGAAEELKAKALSVLSDRIASAEKREAEAAELARLREEAEARAKKDREEQIAREAAEKAKAEAEAKAKAEREASARREAELKEAAERAEQQKKEAEARAERAAKEAQEKAEREAREAREREEAEQRRREADKAHKRKINNEALQALVANGIDDASAKSVIKLIASKSIPHITINY